MQLSSATSIKLILDDHLPLADDVYQSTDEYALGCPDHLDPIHLRLIRMYCKLQQPTAFDENAVWLSTRHIHQTILPSI
jgi:hypothetical protein